MYLISVKHYALVVFPRCSRRARTNHPTMECRRAKPWAVVVVLAVLRAAVAGAAPAGDSPSSQDSVPASVQEVPQRPMTVRSGGLGVDDESSKNPFPIGRGEPFVVDPANVPQNHGPIAGFDGRPRSADRTDEYGSYDYDPAKLEEVTTIIIPNIGV